MFAIEVCDKLNLINSNGNTRTLKIIQKEKKKIAMVGMKWDKNLMKYEIMKVKVDVKMLKSKN